MLVRWRNILRRPDRFGGKRRASVLSRSDQIFRIPVPAKTPIPRPLASMALGTAHKLLSLSKLERIYAALPKACGEPEFLDALLAELRVTCRVSEADLERVPEKGPTVLVANHPFGAIEGIILAHQILKVRSDVRVMANFILNRIPELRRLFFFVDPFETSRSISNNLSAMREALAWLKQGGLLAIFPAGEVSHLKWGTVGISDPKWNTTAARMIRRSGAKVVPAFFEGCNGPLFQMAGLVHPRLRTALLPRELLKRCDQEIVLRLGGPIAAHRMNSRQGVKAQTQYLRWRTYCLGQGGPNGKWGQSAANAGNLSKIKPAPARKTILAELAALPEEQHLVAGREFEVYYFRAEQAPNLLTEIGRQREITFRAVGEGTGQALDLDRFDRYYVHICLWDRKEQRLAGSYRLGPADEILAKYGPKGLYTATLFRFDRQFFRQVAPALEMGRSFLCQEYQRAYGGLLLLWKGIGQYISRNLHYRYLLGPVSVSNNYLPLSRRLIVECLSANYPSPLASLVKPRRPVRFGLLAGGGRRPPKLSGIEELNEVLADIEGPGIGVPVLFRQYLKLAARALAWNLDPEFGDALDCLMVADMMDNDAKTLDRYLGRGGGEKYLSYHLGSKAANG